MRNIIAKALRGLAENLERPESEPQHLAPTKPQPVGLQGGCPASTLDDLLRAYLQGGTDSAVSRIHVISLQDLKVAFGPEWQRLASKAMKMAENVIMKHLGPTDYFYRQGEESFLLLLGGASRGEAERRLTLISRRIQKVLLGERAEHAGAFGVKVAVVTLSDLIASGVVPTVESVTRTLQEEAKWVTDTTRQARPAEASPPTPAPTPAPADPPAEDPPAADRKRAALVSQVQLHYQPAWNPQTGYVEAFQAVAVRTTTYGTFYGTAALNGGATDPLLPVFDEIVLAASLRSASALRERRAGSRIIVPLHLYSFAAEGNDAFLRLLAAPENAQCAEWLEVEIVGIEDDSPVNRLPALISQLSRTFSGVRVRAPLDNPLALGPSASRASTIGLDLADLGRHYKSQALRTSVLKKFIQMSVHSSARPYVWGAMTIKDVIVAEAPYGLISGPAIAPAVHVPGPKYIIDRGKIF